jgi:molybdate transport system substrate-binding protein
MSRKQKAESRGRGLRSGGAGLAVLVVAILALGGCGGGDRAELKVSAASSLKAAFPKYEPDARYSFAGSDELAAQIRAGARPDVFAAANTKLPDALFAAGLVEKPVVFAGNRLVLAVPADGSKVGTLADLEKPGVTIAVGAPSVPVGSYTRDVLGRLGAARSKKILANVRSNEPDVAGVVGKLTQGAVDAGFVYFTDVRATDGRLEAIDLPAGLEPKVEYGVAVVKGTRHHAEARDFVDGLTGSRGQKALADAGFTGAAGGQ